MLLKDKYCPLFLKDSLINQEYYNKLSNIYETPDLLLNTIFHGPNGSGKFNMIKCLLNSMFKENIKCTEKIFKITVNKIDKEILVNTSEYHFEIYLDKYLFSNKLYLFGLIDNITESTEINGLCQKKIIVIRNINHAPKEFLNYLKSKMEHINSSSIFLLTTNNMSKIGKSMLGHFICFRVPYAKKTELTTFIKDIIKKENLPSKSHNFINSLIEKNGLNLQSIFLNLELNISNNEYRHDELYDKKKMIQKLKEPNPENIIFLRNELYNISSKNISVEDIVKDIVLHLIRYEKLSSEQKIKIVEKYSFIQKNTLQCYKNIVIYEAILINIFQILNS